MNKTLNNPVYKLVHNEKGAALVVTIAIVAVLMVAALQLRKITADAMISGQQGRDSYLSEQMAISGIHFASLILAQDAQKNSVDSIQEEWADEEWMDEAVKLLGYSPGALNLKITDELSKIQVNAFLKKFPGNEVNPDQVRIWESFMHAALANEDEETDFMPIINSLKDWMDSLDDDAVSGISGAESDYYMELDPPYACSNGPINQIRELFLVKGIKQDIFKDGIPESSDPQDELVSLEDFFTVFGLDNEALEGEKYRYPGKVNINTAPVEVIAALLPEGMGEFAQDLVDYRIKKGEQGIEFINALDKGWYKRVIDLSEEEEKRFDRTVEYASTLFKVVSVAVENKAKVEMVAFLKREKQANTGKTVCRIIRMERKQ